MGYISRLVNSNEQRGAAINDREWLARINGVVSSSGIAVSADSAMALSAVFACVRVLSESEAMLPLKVYRRSAEGNSPAVDHPLYSILHDSPNPEMTAVNYREAVMMNLTLWGNGYSEIIADRGGRIRQLWPLFSSRMQLKRGPQNQLIYDYDDPLFGHIGFTPDKIMHLRAMAINGLTGLTPIRVHREQIGLGLAQDRFGSKLFENGARPSIALKHPGTLSQMAYDRLIGSWEERHQGIDNVGRMALLEEGLDLVAFGIPPEDAQFLQSRKFSVEEIARIYRVPPHLIASMDHSTFGNIEQQSLEFVIYTMAPWFVRWEQGIGQSLLTPTERTEYFAKHNVDALLRGDTLNRYNAYQIGRNGGWLSANEIRQSEDMNQIPGGDTYLTPLNMTTQANGGNNASA